MTDVTKKADLMAMMGPMIEERGFVAYSSLIDKMIQKYPDLQDSDGNVKSTISAYMNKSSHVSNMKNPIYGEGSGSNVDIRKTKFKIAGEGTPKVGICNYTFDEEITTEQEYENRVYDFTQDEWDQKMRKKPSNWYDNNMSNSVDVGTEEAPSDDTGTGDSDDNEREIRYAEILNRRKNIVLEGPPGTGKTHAIKGVVDQLEKSKEKRGEGLEIGGRGKGDWAITMHPATSYEDFIEGLRPAEKSEGIDAKSSFIYKPGVFVERVRDAIKNPHQQHVVLLDELNRSNVPRVFGDLLTTLEASKRTPAIIPEHYLDAKPKPIECDVVVMAATKPGEGATKGFSYTSYFGNDGDKIEYVGTTQKGEIKHKKIKHTINHNNRNMKVKTFRDSNMTHDFKIEETATTCIILVLINDVYYPIKKDTSFAEYILREQNQDLTNPREITVIDEKGGERNYFCSTFERDVYGAGKHTFYHRVTVYVPSPEAKPEGVDCCKHHQDSEYYWCMECDSLWKKEWGQKSRTEVTLSGSKKKLHIPDNLLVVATMNTTDRSVAPLDAALRRRFVFLRVDPFKKFPYKDKKRLADEAREIFDDTEKLWQELNVTLENTLGPDATIGHSYLFDLKDELVLANSDEKKCDELRKQFWQYSVLPQVADLLDATGRSNVVWNKINLEEKFNRIGLGLDTGPETFKSFARTIVVEVPKKVGEEDSIDTNQTEEESETTEDTEATEPSSVENA